MHDHAFRRRCLLEQVALHDGVVIEQRATRAEDDGVHE
jgi:hypothetical protein